MIYLSKGILADQTDNGRRIVVNHCGRKHELTNGVAQAWLMGRYAPQYLGAARLIPLIEQTLIATQPDKNASADTYRLLTDCVIRPSTKSLPLPVVNTLERRILKWLHNDAIRLTVAELVCLEHKGICPTGNYLGIENRQRLVEAIYTPANIEDGVLEAQMEHVGEMSKVTDALLRLLKRRRIFLL